MPIYDYICTNCAERTEVIHPVHAPGPEACPACGGPLRKALSLPSIVFKGSGWAKKDARSSTSSTAARDAEKPATENATPADKGSSAAKEATASTGD